jgi:hypothetical protein
MRITVVGAVVIAAAVIGALLLIRHLKNQNKSNTGLEPGSLPA